MLTASRLRARQSGFSLIELMIALTAGLIIIGAVGLFTVATMRSYSENILSTLLTQELRTSMNLVVRELRRAGHDSSSVTRVLTDGAASTFGTLSVLPSIGTSTAPGCVVYEYDRQANNATTGADATEKRGIRWNATTGVLQLNATSSTINCTSTSDWVDVTNADTIRITGFTPTLVESKFCAQLQSYPTPDPLDDPSVLLYDIAVGSVKTLSMCLKGQMASGDQITRTVGDAVRVRAEALTFLTGQTAAELATKCLTTATAPKTPTVLSSECVP
jgi:prepilin-type N-terminal cleavage/methylation domain-containing protein